MYVPVLIFTWVATLALELTTSNLSTDIISGVCVPFGIYSSVVAQKAIAFVIFSVTYLLPLVLMVFSYSRIVYALRTQVNSIIFNARQHSIITRYMLSPVRPSVCHPSVTRVDESKTVEVRIMKFSPRSMTLVRELDLLAIS